MNGYALIGACVTVIAAIGFTTWAAATYWQVTLGLTVLGLLIVLALLRRRPPAGTGDPWADMQAITDETERTLQEADDLYLHTRARMERLTRLWHGQ
jgi:hypothetical protein